MADGLHPVPASTSGSATRPWRSGSGGPVSPRADAPRDPGTRRLREIKSHGRCWRDGSPLPYAPMPHGGTFVRWVAREAGCDDLSQAVRVLQGAGMAVSNGESRLGRRDARRARRLLAAARGEHSDVVRPDKPAAHAVPAGLPGQIRSGASGKQSAPRAARPQKGVARAKRPRWPTAREEYVVHLTTDEVIEIHSALTQEFAGTPDAVEPRGVKDLGGLERAVNRARTAQRLYPNVLLSGAALVHSLNCNHAFHNGNKRTSLLALAIFLEKKNGRYIECAEDQLFHLIAGIAAHTLVSDQTPSREHDPYYSDREVIAVYRTLRSIVSRPRREDRNLKWRELVSALERFGCEVAPLKSNQAKIRRRLSDGRMLTAVGGATNTGTEIDASQVRAYRKQLELDDEHNVDSGIFYDGRDPHPELPDLIRRYRGVLERLSLLDRT